MGSFKPEPLILGIAMEEDKEPSFSLADLALLSALAVGSVHLIEYSGCMAVSTAAILSRLMERERAALTPEVARFFLRLDFSADEVERMNELAEKARAGTLTAEERAETEGYMRAGDMLAILRSKARVALRAVCS